MAAKTKAPAPLPEAYGYWLDQYRREFESKGLQGKALAISLFQSTPPRGGRPTLSEMSQCHMLK